MARYFQNFPLIQYNGKLCRSLVSRASISQDVIKATSVFYPYANKLNEKAHTISLHYYEDSYKDWLLYYANDIIDPYYGWYLDGDQFNAYIVDKYGSLYEAQLYVHHYMVNWIGDDTQLTISAYNALPATSPTNTKKYWRPLVDEYNTVTAYVRKQLDTTANTNKTIKISMPSTVGYQLGEVVSQFNNNVLVGYCEITHIDPDYILAQHVTGNVTSAHPLTGFASGASFTPTSVTVVSNTIPVEEQIYWRPVTIYEYEEALNEQRKILRVVGKQYADLAASNLSMVLG